MQLLEWIADMNWPVAQELIKVLPRFHKELMIDIKYILSDKVDDSIWKYWIINSLLPLFPPDSQSVFLPYIQRLAAMAASNEEKKTPLTLPKHLSNHFNKRTAIHIIRYKTDKRDMNNKLNLNKDLLPRITRLSPTRILKNGRKEVFP